MRLLILGKFVENSRVCDLPQVVVLVKVDEFLGSKKKWMNP
jgi:hypothetical protein